VGLEKDQNVSVGYTGCTVKSKFIYM